MEYYFIICGTSILLGILINEIFHRRKKMHGTLQIDHSDPEKDVYRLHIDDLDGISNKKYLWLSIQHDVDLSQK